MKYCEWLNFWLENDVKVTDKIRTYEKYGSLCKTELIPKLGEYELEELTPMVLQRFVTDILQHGNDRTGEGLAPSTVNCVITVIQSGLKSAYRMGELKEYTADRIKRPKIPDSEIVCFSKTEQKWLEKAALSDRREKMKGIVICLYTGLRIGELLALTWDDIDFKSATMHITKSCHQGRDEENRAVRIVGTPKTPSSKRVIPIPRNLLSILRDMKKQSCCGWVIASDGKPISERSYARSFELLQAKMRIPHRNFHALRHTFATRALECGMDVKTLAEVLGHKNPTVTLTRYAHSMTAHKRDMMNRLGKML